MTYYASHHNLDHNQTQFYSCSCSKVRTIYLNSNAPFICSHLQNSKKLSLIFHFLSKNLKYTGNFSVISTLIASKEKKLVHKASL